MKCIMLNKFKMNKDCYIASNIILCPGALIKTGDLEGGKTIFSIKMLRCVSILKGYMMNFQRYPDGVRD